LHELQASVYIFLNSETGSVGWRMTGGIEMAFTIVGEVKGVRVRVTWDSGKLAGDLYGIELLTLAAESLEGEAVGPIGQQTTVQHLSSGLSTLTLALGVFQVVELLGDIPEAEAVQDGAII
jgi:hypothetical protein